MLVTWDEEQFKEYVRKCILKHYWVSASEITASSFYIAEVIKPEHVTVRRYPWLYSIAKTEIQIFKQQIH